MSGALAVVEGWIRRLPLANPLPVAHPEWTAPLILAVTAALCALAFARWRAGRRGARLLGAAAPPTPGRPDLLAAGALVAIAVALVGPQWGERSVRLPASGIDVVVLIDVSRSMQARDVPPSRVQRARQGAAAVLRGLAAGDRAALAAFAGHGVLLTPLTPDRDALLELLPAFDPELMSNGGSQLAAGVASALPAFEERSPRPRVLLVLSDGEASGDSADGAAARAARVRVITVAIGSEAGARLPGESGPLRDARGEIVVSRRVPGQLAALAQATDGVAFLADAWGAVDATALVKALRRDALAAPDGFALRREAVTRSAPFAALALALLLAEALPRSRRRAALAGFAPLAALLLAASPGEDPDAETLLQTGLVRAAAGDWAGAEHAFFAAAVRTRVPELASEAHYDLGVAALARDDFARARDAFFDAIALDPGDRQAQFNLEWTLGRMAAEPGAAGEPPKRPAPPPGASGDPGEGEKAPEPAPEERSRAEAERGASEGAQPGRTGAIPAPALSPEEAARWLDRVHDDPARALRAALPADLGQTRAGAIRSGVVRRRREGPRLAPVLARLLGAALGLSALAADAVEAPLCVTRLRLVPERAFVGQQVLYEVRILRRKDVAQLDWDPAPSFPAFRSEWLPGMSGDAHVERGGESYAVYHERRALFPTRAGMLTVPGAGLRCSHAEGEERVAIEAGELAVEPLPEAAGDALLVGKVEVSVTATPRRLALGETLRVSVVLGGPSNLWDARAPLDATDFPEAELFAHPPELARDTGRRLGLRRYFVYDVVPRRSGSLRVPALVVPWLDPERREMRTTQSEAVEITVGPAPARPELPAGAPEPPGPVPAPGETDGSSAAKLAAVLAVVASLGAIGALLALGRRGTDGSAGANQEALGRAEALLAAGEIDAGCATFARALRDALRPRIPEARALSSEEIRARAGDDRAVEEAAGLLAHLERARFDPGAPPPEPAAVRSALQALKAPVSSLER